VSPEKASLFSSNLNTNCHGLSLEDVETFFVPSTHTRKFLNSSATCLSTAISLADLAFNLIQTGAPVGGPLDCVATSTLSHSDSSGANQESILSSTSNTLINPLSSRIFESKSSTLTLIVFPLRFT